VAQVKDKEMGIGVAELSERLGPTPQVLRAFIRTQDLGVGRASRHRWASLSDPKVKRIIVSWGQKASKRNGKREPSTGWATSRMNGRRNDAHYRQRLSG
jgi:hypothetical protein